MKLLVNHNSQLDSWACFHQHYIGPELCMINFLLGFVFLIYIAIKTKSELFMLPKFIYHKFPKVIMYWMGHVPNDARLDAQEHFYDFRIMIILLMNVGLKWKKGHISGPVHAHLWCISHFEGIYSLQIYVFSSFS